MKKPGILIFFILLFVSSKVFAENIWINDLKSLFLANNAVIYAINIRTFNASDRNKNGIIEEDLGEERGNFLNAIYRLDELAMLGVNTVNLLPVTPVGKVKALGTAGSLYAASSFNELNPQLKCPDSNLSLKEEMRKFVNECHKRKIRVIVDLPCCGSYDLYLQQPELFIKDKNKNPIIPADWTDVRLLDGGTESQINNDVYNMYSEFIDLMVELGVDGVKANVPTLKPAAFWKKLIYEKRAGNPQFLFLAEASPYWSITPSEHITLTPFNKLMDTGFDGYYGDYSNLKDWKTASSLISHIKSDIALAKKYSGSRKVIGNFATHDQISPILLKGTELSKMIVWLNATLPINSYYIDGFSTGDDYIYFLANKKAQKTFTDDEYYFVHRGQLDIFNFSRRPLGKHYDILQDFAMAGKLKAVAANALSKGDFVPLKTSSSSVFAYSRNYDLDSVIVIGNLDFKNTQKVTVNAPKLNKDVSSIPIKISINTPIVANGKIETVLAPGEVQVLYFTVLIEKK
ncbi:MAG: hypothetical protein PHC64_07910 [Candidatus Gastranaerophilales bacterium]|nr:hypothetical protein [Candidatus Gastranaerophilales bacterium]